MVNPRHQVYALVICLGLVVACRDRGDQYGDVNVSANIDTADGLDLEAVGELVKVTKSAEELEAKLNEEGGINNLDLNADGKVDFIQVTEYEEGKVKGFSLVVEPAKGEKQEIATIEVEKKGEAADVFVSGNQHIYGMGHHYHYHYPSFGSMLLMSYMFRPHPLYYSPFHFGMYPRYYGMGYGRVSRVAYVTRTRGRSSGSGGRRISSRKSSSPNKGRNASKGIRSSLRNPTKSQKSFRSKSQRTASRSKSQRRFSTRRSSPRRSSGRRSFRGRGRR